MPLQEHVLLHTAKQVVKVPVPQFQSSASTSRVVPSAALPIVNEHNASTPARAWELIASCWCSSVEKDRLRLLGVCSSAGVFVCPLRDLEGGRRAMMLKRDALEASAEQAALELLADEAATKPVGSFNREQTTSRIRSRRNARRSSTWVSTTGSPDERFRKNIIELGRTEEVCREMDKLANEDHTHHATGEEINVYRNNWWIRSNFVGSDTMPIRHRADFKEALSTFRRLKNQEDQA